MHALDATRLIDATSGWYDQHCGDFHSVHNYFRPLEVYKDADCLITGYFADSKHLTRRAFVLSEFGGLTCAIARYSALREAYGYAAYASLPEWQQAVQEILQHVKTCENQGLTGFAYTQLTDVEGELNGLLTYDRRIINSIQHVNNAH